MAGVHKCFVMTPAVHAEPLFILDARLTSLGHVGGGPPYSARSRWLLVVGWWIGESIVGLGLVLILVTYGHLSLEPQYSFSGHVIPRLAASSVCAAT